MSDPTKPETYRAYGIMRTRPDENNGQEFFHCALWHKDTILSEGERYVEGFFVPESPKAPAVGPKRNLSMYLEVTQTPADTIDTPEFRQRVLRMGANIFTPRAMREYNALVQEIAAWGEGQASTRFAKACERVQELAIALEDVTEASAAKDLVIESLQAELVASKAPSSASITKRWQSSAPNESNTPKQGSPHVATYCGVEFTRYTIEWTNGPLPEGTKLYAAPLPGERLNFLQSGTKLRYGLVRLLAQFAISDLGEYPASKTSEAILRLFQAEVGKLPREGHDNGIAKYFDPSLYTTSPLGDPDEQQSK